MRLSGQNNLISLIWHLWWFVQLPLCIDIVNAKGNDNIVLHGGGGGGHGGGGCCGGGGGGGGGALIYEHGKGKKKEKVIIKDDNLIMQNGNADGNIIMDGSNLIMKEGKKNENIVIKGSSGGCCDQHEHHKEEHVSHPMPIHIKHQHTKERRVYVPIPVHHKKKVVHHHHKEVHHHEDQGAGYYHRQDHEDSGSQFLRKKGRLMSKPNKIVKLKLGEKLSDEQKAKLKRDDRSKRRLGNFASQMFKRLSTIRGGRTKGEDESSPTTEPKDDGDESSANGDSSDREPASSESSDQPDSADEDQDQDQSDDFFSMLGQYSPVGFSSFGGLGPSYAPLIMSSDEETSGASTSSPTKRNPGLSSPSPSKLSTEDFPMQSSQTKSSESKLIKSKESQPTIKKLENRMYSTEQPITTLVTMASSEPITSESILQPIFAPDERFNNIQRTMSPLSPGGLLSSSHLSFRAAFPPPPRQMISHSMPIATLSPPIPQPSTIDSVTGMLLLATQEQNRMLQQQLIQNQQLVHQQQQLLLQQQNKTIKSKNPMSDEFDFLDENDSPPPIQKIIHSNKRSHRPTPKSESSLNEDEYQEQPSKSSTFQNRHRVESGRSRSSRPRIHRYSSNSLLDEVEPLETSTSVSEYWENNNVMSQDFDPYGKDMLDSTLLTKRRDGLFGDFSKRFQLRPKMKSRRNGKTKLFQFPNQERQSNNFFSSSKPKFPHFLDEETAEENGEILANRKNKFTDLDQFEQFASSELDRNVMHPGQHFKPFARNQFHDKQIKVNEVHLNNNGMIKSYSSF